MDDGALVREAVGGSIPAFTAIFDRHAPQVHDVALALVRDPSLALEVLHATFAEAGERLEALKEPDRLLVWLLAITRFHAHGVAGAEAATDRQPAWRRGARHSEDDGTEDDADPSHQAGLMWKATADLPLRERALLDFRLRQNLDGNDLEDALGVSSAEATELRAWMDATEDGLAGYMIMRRADRRCSDLPLVLRGWDGHFTPLVASHIATHVYACRTCRAARDSLPSSFALYASVPQAPLPGSEGPEVPARHGSSATEAQT